MGDVKCADIFKNSHVDYKNSIFRLHEKKSTRKYLRDRKLKNSTEVRLSKLKLVLGLKSLLVMECNKGLIAALEVEFPYFSSISLQHIAVFLE